MSRPGNFDSLKDQVREISRISAAVPEEFRLKCFELLMTHLLKGGLPSAAASGPQALPGPVAGPLPVTVATNYASAPPMSALVSAFVRKIALTNEQFWQVVGYVHGNVIFLREPSGETGAQAQIHWALLVALRNAINKGSFLVDPEEVRIVCQEKGVYDRRTFYTTFRRHGELFRTAPEPGGKPQPLSSKGIAAVGDLVRNLAGQA